MLEEDFDLGGEKGLHDSVRTMVKGKLSSKVCGCDGQRTTRWCIEWIVEDDALSVEMVYWVEEYDGTTEEVVGGG